MPNRMLRDWTGSDKINNISVHAERFLIRLIMKVDDYGCFYADSRLLKANLFPLILDNVRDADILRWMAECQKAGLIVVYENSGKRYVMIVDFKQRLDRAKSKYPLPNGNELPVIVNDIPPEQKGTGTEPEKNRANALVDANAPTDARTRLKHEYTEMLTTVTGKDSKEIWTSLKGFIGERKPDFIEPFIDSWNLFASIYKLSSIESISESRRKKFGTRCGETGFDFLRVLEKIKSSPHLKGDNQRGWKVTFDWIIENDKNYLKIIEGQYE